MKYIFVIYRYDNRQNANPYPEASSEVAVFSLRIGSGFFFSNRGERSFKR